MLGVDCYNGNMGTMLLERRLVKILWDETLNNGEISSKEDFVEFFIATKKWPCSRCEQCKNRISFALEHCIQHSYITKKPPFEVTAQGKAFIQKVGYFEEILKRHRRTSIAFGATLALIISVIFLLISSVLPYLLGYKM